MKTKIFILILLFGFSAKIFSQKARVESANKKYDNYSYVDAIAIYESVAKKGF